MINKVDIKIVIITILAFVILGMKLFPGENDDNKIIKVGGKKITETMTDATFASILHSITGNTEDIAKVIKGKKLSADEREQLLLEALLAKKKGK